MIVHEHYVCSVSIFVFFVLLPVFVFVCGRELYFGDVVFLQVKFFKETSERT